MPHWRQAGVTNLSIELSITKYKRVLTNQLSSIPVSFNINLLIIQFLNLSFFLFIQKNIFQYNVFKVRILCSFIQRTFILNAIALKIGTLTLFHDKLYCSFKTYPWDENYNIHILRKKLFFVDIVNIYKVDANDACTFMNTNLK